MGTKLNKVPSTEKELNELLQEIYSTAKSCYELRQECNFTGILEIVASEPNIVSAIHKIKGNKGSHTAGVDGKVIDANEVKVYASIPNKETLISKMMGSLQAPIGRMRSCIAEPSPNTESSSLQ